MRGEFRPVADLLNAISWLRKPFYDSVSSRDGEFEMAISAQMGRQVAVVLYGVAMAAVIVGVDAAFFRNHVWERLVVNVGIVLVFAAFYLRFLR